MLKGIDTQMMVTRTAEMTRNVDAQQRKNELVRDYLAVQGQTTANQETQQVAQTLKAQEAMIHKDKQEKRRPDSEEADAEETEYLEEAAADEYIPRLSGNHNIIDIQV